MLPEPAFFAFMGFSTDPGETWVRWFFLGFVDFMGRFVGFVLGFVEFMGCSLNLSLGSLDLWGVRWICPGFVDFMGCSLDYRFSLGEAQENEESVKESESVVERSSTGLKHYRVYVAKMGTFRDSSNYEYIAEFESEKLASNYVHFMLSSATTGYYGVTKLSSSTSSTSTTLAATASAVKAAYDRNTWDSITLSNPLGMAYGGTGANNSATARSNLGIKG